MVQVGAGAGSAVKSVTGMIMPGNRKEEKDARNSDTHQDNQAAMDLDEQLKKDPKKMEKAVSFSQPRGSLQDSFTNSCGDCKCCKPHNGTYLFALCTTCQRAMLLLWLHGSTSTQLTVCGR